MAYSVSVSFSFSSSVSPGFREQFATKFENIARKYYRERGREIEIIRLNGSIEVAPILGLSDVIVDIVETGSTLKENGLTILEEICPLSARMIVNQVSMKMESERIRELIAKIRVKL